MSRIANRARDITTGEPITSGSAFVFGPDGATLAALPVDAEDGLASYQANGQPGSTIWQFTGLGQTKNVAGDVMPQSGNVMLGELDEILQIFSDGVYQGAPITAPGGMNVAVGIGRGFTKGVFHPLYTAETLPVIAAHPTLGRIDRIVSELTRSGTFAGRVRLQVKLGTPAVTPVVPTLVQDAATWEVEWGRLTIPAAASAITSGMISTAFRAVSSAAIPAASITEAMLAKPSVGTAELFDAAVTDPKIVSVDYSKLTGVPAITRVQLPGLIASYWISSAGILGGAVANFTCFPNILYACPIYIPAPTTITELALDKTTATSAAPVYFAIYTARADGLPGTRVGVAGPITMGSTVAVQLSGVVAIPLTAGWYWAAVVFNGANKIFQGLFNPRDLLGSPGPGDNTNYGFAQGLWTYASPPSTFPSPAVSAAGPTIFLETSGTV
jgi:hypothetical protein